MMTTISIRFCLTDLLWLSYSRLGQVPKSEPSGVLGALYWNWNSQTENPDTAISSNLLYVSSTKSVSVGRSDNLQQIIVMLDIAATEIHHMMMIISTLIVDSRGLAVFPAK